MQAVGSGLVNVLLPCLTQGSLTLACATVEALMQITIAVPGKQAMVRRNQCGIRFCFLAQCTTWQMHDLPQRTLALKNLGNNHRLIIAALDCQNLPDFGLDVSLLHFGAAHACVNNGQT